MKENLSYSEKLKHPLWQKKRLEIMQRDEFMCQNCGEEDKQLNVHHKYYKKNTDIWDYDDYNFVTLCNECHEIMHEKQDSLNRALSKINIDFYENITEILYYLSKFGHSKIYDITQVVKYCHKLIDNDSIINDNSDF